MQATNPRIVNSEAAPPQAVTGSSSARRVRPFGCRVLTSKPLADAFLHGWTPDDKKLVCYRDWKAFLVALDGTQSDFVDVGRGVYTERAEYFATRHTFCWNWGRGPQLLEWDIVCSDGSVLVRKDSFLTDLMVLSPDEKYLAVLGASGPVGTTKDNNLWSTTGLRNHGRTSVRSSLALIPIGIT